jgi:hypothetical protein
MAEDYKTGVLTDEKLKQNAESVTEIDVKYTQTVSAESNLYRAVYEESRQAREYQSFRDTVTDGENMFLGERKLFQQRSLEKTKQDYSKLSAVSPKFDGLYGVSLFAGIHKSEYGILLLIVFVTVALFWQERQNQMGYLLYAAPRGQRTVGISKYTAGMSVTTLLVLAYTVFQMLVINLTYGMGDKNSVIQSVPGFTSCPYPLTVRQFLVWYILFRILVGWMLYSVFFFLNCMIRTGWFCVLVSICLLLCCAILHGNLRQTSRFAILYYYNPITMFDAANVIVNYHNGNIFGYPVSCQILYLVLSILIAVFTEVAAVFLFGTNLLLPAGHHRNGGKIGIKEWNFRLLDGEVFKCLVVQRGGLLFAVFAVIVLLFSPAVTDDLSSYHDVYYKNYIQKLEGRYSDSKLESLQKEKEELKKAQQLLDEGNITTESSQLLKQQLEKKQALHRAIRYGKYLSEKKDSCFVYAQGYLLFLGIKKRKIVLWYDMISLLITAFLSWLICSIDKETGMEQLIVSSAQGKKKIDIVKQKTAALLTFATSVLVGAFFLATIGREYGFAGLTASAQSIRQLSFLPSCIKIWEVMLFRFAASYLVMLLCSYVICILCQKSEKGEGK